MFCVCVGVSHDVTHAVNSINNAVDFSNFAKRDVSLSENDNGILDFNMMFFIKKLKSFFCW